mmetsp:Transcript_111983/g.210021  ORF Transcript_111983/g.210021 Transcript_111983/m.210021 type:complete len:269 (-) Transcript_111983:92-898(-)
MRAEVWVVFPRSAAACLCGVWLALIAGTDAFRPEGVDPYEALGLKRGDDLGAGSLKKAYRKAALRWHPDKVKDEDRAEAEKKFIEIAWAYEVLSDPGKRAEFERAGHQSGPQAGHADRDFSMKEAAKVFEDVFGAASPEFNDLIQHLATASGHGDKAHWRKHAADIAKATKGKGNQAFTVETKTKDGSGRIKTSQTVTNDGRGTTTKKTVTQHTQTSTSGGKPQALHGADPALDAHHRAHEAAVRAAQEAHMRALGGAGRPSIGHTEF